MTSVSRQALASVGGFTRLVRAGVISRPKNRIGQRVRPDRGGVYMVFRETVGNDGSAAEPAVLVVGFRLKLIGSNPIFHWIFQRICLLTTPFWSGFRGFRVKLWMVDQASKNYLGIYQWAGTDNARAYAETLCRVLRPLSTRDSVWYDLHADQELEDYLAIRAA